MSSTLTYDPVSTATFEDVLTQDPSQGNRRKPKSRNNPARLANRTQWALGDILRIAQEGRQVMEEIARWIDYERIDAKGRYDTARLARLGELSQIYLKWSLRVAELERLAADARMGEYAQKPLDEPRRKGQP